MHFPVIEQCWSARNSRQSGCPCFAINFACSNEKFCRKSTNKTEVYNPSCECAKGQMSEEIETTHATAAVREFTSFLSNVVASPTSIFVLPGLVRGRFKVIHAM